MYGACTKPQCLGAPLENGLCLAHLPHEDLAALAAIVKRHREDGLNLRGVDVDRSLFRGLGRVFGPYWGKCDFTASRFPHLASFSNITFAAGTSFRGAIFGDHTSFSPSSFDGDVDFVAARFGEDADLMQMRLRGVLNLDSAVFEDVRMQLFFPRLDYGQEDVPARLSLDQAVFHGRAKIESYSPVDITMSRTTFNSGFSLIAVGTLTGEAIDIGRSSIIIGSTGRREMLKIRELDGMDLDQLTLSGVDMTEFHSFSARDLSRLRFDGDIRFRLRRNWLGTSRKILAQEFDPDFRGPEGASVMANLYRALRKSSEESKDHITASDFYYGEMRMRRKALARSWNFAQLSERALLALYWAVGGYGVRPLRPFLSLLALIAAVTVLLMHCGSPEGKSFEAALRETLGFTVAFLRPPAADEQLTGAGFYAATAARVLAPVLLALTALGIRARLRR